MSATQGIVYMTTGRLFHRIKCTVCGHTARVGRYVPDGWRRALAEAETHARSHTEADA